MSDSVPPHGLYPTRLLCPWDSPGKKAGVGCHALLQGIFPTQGWNLCLLHLLCWQGDFFTASAIWEAPMGPNFIIIYLAEYQWMMLDRHSVMKSSSILSGGSDLFPLFSASFILFSPSVLTSDVISFINSLTGYILHFCVLI